MNPTLLQHPYPIEYPVSTDNNNNRYLSQDRPFSNSALTTNNFLDHRNRLTNGPLSQQLGLHAPNSGLEYAPSSLLQEPPYPHQPHLLLSPPSSIDGSSISSAVPTTSSLGYLNIPKLSPSNGSSIDQYSSTTGSFVPTAWSGSNMSDYNSRPRHPNIGHGSSPPLNYTPSNGMNGSYYDPPRPVGLTQLGSYRSNLPSEPLFNHAGPRQSLHPPFPYPSSFPPFHLPTSQPPRMPPDGPPFEETKSVLGLVTGNGQPLHPEISASVQKGFFQVDGKWTCYRRNYFAVSCAFTFKEQVPEGPVFLQRNSHSRPDPVQQYAVSIAAKTQSMNNQESEVRALVQHTPKRDKATESIPGRHPVQPAQHSSLATNNVHGGSFPMTQQMSLGMMSSFDSFNQQVAQQAPPTSYTFERIQFQKATANNGKRRAQQQYFHIVVELQVNVGRMNGPAEWVVVASKESSPMVVRGRSPGHYKDNAHRDSQASMDPDRGAGPGNNGGNGGYSMPPPGTGPLGGMNWAPSHHRHGHSYGNYHGRQIEHSNCSSSSGGSSSTLTESPSELDFHPSDTQPPKSNNLSEFERAMLTPGSEKFDPRVHHLDHHSPCRKRLYDDYGSDLDLGHYGSSLADEAQTPLSFDFSSSAHSKALCASS